MRILVLFFFVVVSVSSNAQDFELTSINLTVQSGLPSDNVYCAIQDRDGYIWFGTETGVSRYNGREFENFDTSDGLAGNEIFKIAQDKKGRIWFSAFNGELSYFLNGKFFNENNDPYLAEVKPNYFFRAFLEDTQGRIWLGVSGDGIYTIEADGSTRKFMIPKNYKPGNILYFKEVDRKVFVYSVAGEFMLFDGEAYPITMEAPLNGIHDFIDILSVKDNGMRGVLLGNLSIWSNDYFNRWTEKYGKDGRVTKLNFYENEFWLSTYNGAFVTKKTGDLLQLPETRYFEGKRITHVLKDREGGYWFTSLGDGVFYVPSLSAKTLKNIGQKKVINSLLAMGDQVWFGGEELLYGYVTGEKAHPSNDSFFSNRSLVKSIHYDSISDRMILIGEDYVVETKNLSFTRRVRLSTKSFKQWTKDLIAFGTGRNLFVFTREEFSSILDIPQSAWEVSVAVSLVDQSYQFKSTGLWVSDIEKYNGGLLLATLKGLYFLDPDFTLQPVQGPSAISERISDIHVDKNGQDYTLATYGYGVLRKRDNEWTQISTKDGLTSDITNKIWSEHADTLWVATNQGVNRISLTDGLQVKPLMKTHGIASEDVRDVLVKANKLYAATSEGLSVIDLTQWGKRNANPSINFREFKVDGIAVKKDDIELSHNTRGIDIEFDGIHFSSAERLSYQYRLLGLNDRWVSTTSDVVNFGKLSPGGYTFQVKAISAFGNESQVIEKPFIVASPFWLTWWFITLATATFLTLVILVSRYLVIRAKGLEKKKYDIKVRIAEAERKALQSQLNPHFIFNALSSIQNMIFNQKSEEAFDYLDKFSKLIRRVLELSDVSMISIRQELETLSLYMELENLRLGNKFDYHINVSEDIDQNRELPSLLLQPYIENAIWHGIMPLPSNKRGNIRIELWEEEDKTRITITDNGVGRPPGSDTNGMGTRLTNDLVKTMDEESQVIIEDLWDNSLAAGTRVNIQILTNPIAYD